VIRRATADDADAVHRVWEEVAAEGEWIGAEAPLRPDWKDRFRSAVEDPAIAWFVVVDDGTDEVIGGLFAQVEPSGLGHVGMAILDGHRGQGIGRRLLDAAIDWARSKDAHKVVLEVWPHNERARALYRSAGFADEGVLRRHYRRRSGALWDAVTMGLLLDNDSPGRS
jgi:RimJ/RimL family protein N-acetyltransferase